MSAVNIFLFADRIDVWTDGACYDAGGLLVERASKVGFLPHLSGIVATRGPAIATPLLAHYLGAKFETFDDLADQFGEALASIVDQSAPAFEDCDHGPAFEAYLAGWRQEGPPEAYRSTSLQPGRVERLPGITVAPGDQAIFERMKQEYPGIDDNWLARPPIGIRMMELQREMIRKEQVPGRGIICGIGGFVQLTMISRQGTMTQILRRWPDEIGEPIGAEVNPPRRAVGRTLQ